MLQRWLRTAESGPCSGGPTTSKTPENVDHVWAAINKDRQLTAWELEADLRFPKPTVPEILMQDLVMKYVVAKFILQLRLPEQTEHSASVAIDLIQITTNEQDLLKKVITWDVWWIYNYDWETKVQLSQWKSPGSPHPKEEWQSCIKFKTRLTVFFDWEGVVHHGYASQGQTINKEYYLNVLLWLRESIQQKWWLL